MWVNSAELVCLPEAMPILDTEMLAFISTIFPKPDGATETQQRADITQRLTACVTGARPELNPQEEEEVSENKPEESTIGDQVRISQEHFHKQVLNKNHRRPLFGLSTSPTSQKTKLTIYVEPFTPF